MTFRQFCWSCAVVATSCANPIAPTGGPKDVAPPQVVAEASTPNFQTQFRPKTIVLTFDEWVKLEEVQKQVLVSPPLVSKLVVKLRRRSVVVDLSAETLRDSATYTFNFGTAVRDLTESNPATDLRFVFSTGDYIDSLRLTGTLTDALTQNPVEGALMMLYHRNDDSMPYRDRPFYVATSDKLGKFSIENIRAGAFKAFALRDANLNYRFDAGERIGFVDTMLVFTDTTDLTLTLPLFDNAQPLRITRAYKDRYGHLKLSFNQPFYLPAIVNSLTTTDYRALHQADTLHLWYADTATSHRLVLTIGQLADTLALRLPPRPTNTAAVALRLQQATKVIQQHPDETLVLRFNQPLRALQPQAIALLEDSTRNPVSPRVWIDSTDQRVLRLAYRFKESTPYEVVVPPDALVGWWQTPLLDTLRQQAVAQPRANYGRVVVAVEGMDSTQQYVAEVTNSMNAVVKKWEISGVTTFNNTVAGLVPGQYHLRLIADTNRNGRWDTGNYPHYQPERILQNSKPADLRPNWDVELKLIIDN